MRLERLIPLLLGIVTAMLPAAPASAPQPDDGGGSPVARGQVHETAFGTWRVAASGWPAGDRTTAAGTRFCAGKDWREIADLSLDSAAIAGPDEPAGPAAPDDECGDVSARSVALLER